MKKHAYLTTGVGLCLVLAGPISQLRADPHSDRPQERDSAGRLEPGAGAWRTWVISSGKDYRVPPPPGAAETRAELRLLAELTSQIDAPTQSKLEFWDAGAPSYRWMDLVNSRVLAGTPTTSWPHRVYTCVAQAMYDATVAGWEAKYFYRRPRPSELSRQIETSFPVPNSPSYPSEHAATAFAAAGVLAYLLPAEAQNFRTLAEQAGWSRVLAGLQYPSDYYAGMALGKKVAEQVIAKAKLDGSDAIWTGTVPTGTCLWRGSNPGNVTAANWRPILMSSPGQFRPPAPPACDSPESAAQAAAVLAATRNFATISKAFAWQMPDGLQVWPFRLADKWMSEHHLDQNPPRAARVYALVASVMFDAFIASQDGKFAYRYLRPSQLDSAIVPLFAVPNFPSYPSNHATFSNARGEMLAYLFPENAAYVRAYAKEAGDSRVWAGIHYPMDIDAGTQLGRSVAQLFVAWAQSDGSQ